MPEYRLSFVIDADSEEEAQHVADYLIVPVGFIGNLDGFQVQVEPVEQEEDLDRCSNGCVCGPDDQGPNGGRMVPVGSLTDGDVVDLEPLFRKYGANPGDLIWAENELATICEDSQFEDHGQAVTISYDGGCYVVPATETIELVATTNDEHARRLAFGDQA